ncbi:MAG: general secretion pathway protein GspK [Planctomycetes bacterium]|nr:general secretion pathway protein GspK [Planctomycetota bacterium]
MSARSPIAKRPEERERGVILILVLILLVAVTALALTLAQEARVELAVATQRVDALRLRGLLDSGIELAMAEVRADEEDGDSLSAPWRDDPAKFQELQLDGGRIWLLLSEPDPGDGREVRYGVRDESSKLDINIASADQLLALPGITQEAVDGIVDWRDSDDEVSDQGAEAGYYSTLDPPYTAKNGPIESLDELLRIRGIDAYMLYGEDRNRNGVLDPGEDDGDGSFPPDDADGYLDRGLIDYLTVFSRELNRNKNSQARLVWSQAQLGEIRDRLTAAGASGPFVQRVQLVKAQAGQASTLAEIVFRVGQSSRNDLAALLDEITVVEGDVIPGRINVNTCPRQLLSGLGLEEGQIDAILERRLQPDQDLSSPAWLSEVLEFAAFAQIVDQVTTRSDQFTIQVVALLDDRPRFMRAEVLIDRSFVPVRILLRRDLTALGFPIPEARGEELP